MSNPDTDLKFTLFPMIHVGSPLFYREVGKDLERFQFVLYEGTTWRKDGKARPMYDWAAKNLGLVTQHALRFPETATCINIDMPADEFRARFLRSPIYIRLLLPLLRPLFWLLTFFPSFREYGLTSIVVREARKYGSSGGPRDRLILDRRDAHITGRIREFVAERRDAPDDTFVAVVFGAGHMIAISRCLRDLGFHPTSKRWFDVMRLKERDAEHDDGAEEI